MRFFSLLLLLDLALQLAACSPQSAGPPVPVAAQRPSPNTAEEPLWRTCALANEDFACAIDSCNCGDLAATSDTITVELMPSGGGEIQGRVLKISHPECDGSYVLLRQHQNRYYVSSMGPDPLLTDWQLYTSPVDTIRFDPRLQGFPIDTIPQAAQARFPQFDTLSFYRAYQRAVGDNLRSAAVPDNAKAALHEEYTRAKTDAYEVLQLSGVELHRIMLTLKKGSHVQKVLLFNYGHFG